MAFQEGTSGDASISAYAELLPNIRQISLAVSLPTPRDASTAVMMAQDGARLFITHGGYTAKMTLPEPVVRPPGGILPPPKTAAARSKDLIWRLPLAGKISPARLARPTGRGQDQPIPWPATELRPETRLTCRACSAVVVPDGTVSAWKDLPSENWAEMMEFWHCHKPTVHGGHNHDQTEGGTDKSHPPGGHASNGAVGTNGDGNADEASLASRGYGSNSSISAQPGVGFVDLTSFWFAEEDTTGVTFSYSTYEQGSAQRSELKETSSTGSPPRSLNVFCTACKSQIGHFNLRTSAVTLFKWQVSFPSGTRSSSARLPSLSQCLGSALVASVALTGSSKAVLLPPFQTNQSATAIHIWILNSSIAYSSSKVEGAVPAIKLLYRVISNEVAEKMLEDMASDAQEINFPQEAIDAVAGELGESNFLLPNNERVFKEWWKVGLLSRWE